MSYQQLLDETITEQMPPFGSLAIRETPPLTIDQPRRVALDPALTLTTAILRLG